MKHHVQNSGALNKDKHLKFVEPNLFNKFTSGFLQIHDHRYYRQLYCLLIFIHMIITLVTADNDLVIKVSEKFSFIFSYFQQIWPFPTFTMLDNDQIHINNIIYKILEIFIILLYTIDLLPKIFVWNKPFYWKLINVFVVTIMVLQVPLTMIGYQQSGLSKDNLKLRICSISLSFLLLCEIMSIREKKSIVQQNLMQNNKKKSAVEFREYTWAEIVKHDKPSDCWIVIHGNVYDVTDFVKVHPGGPMIYDGAGGDCTPMWHSYHGSAYIKQGVPEKYLIGKVKGFKEFYSYDGDFYLKLKERVEKLLPKGKKQNDPKLIIKSIILMICFGLAVYYYIKTCNWISAVLLGLAASQVDVNIMHDGNHLAYTSNKFLSYLAGYTLDLTGSTAVVYRRSHNYGHHGCVNHVELDQAFHTTYPLMRLSPTQKKLWFHKYQHYYTFFLYSFVNFGDLFGTFDEMYWLSNYPMRRGYLTKTSFVIQCIAKIIWITYTMIIPSYIHGWYEIFPVWFLYMQVFSYGYSLFFAVNHWTDEAQQVDYSNIENTNWGILQIVNSTNFAIDSTFWTHASGGLNYQIEHHLFPSYAHTRLPEITHIVQDMCKEYNLRYVNYPTFYAALKGHYNHLKKMATLD